MRTPVTPRLRRRLAAAATALVVAALGLPLLTAGPASAADITVTTLDDEVSANGQTSLREAITTANGTGAADVVQLAAGATYELDLCTPEANPNNVAGDLDTAFVGGTLTVRGSGTTTIHQTCAGERIFHAFNALVLEGLILTGGDQDSGSVWQGASDLTLDGVAIYTNAGDHLLNGTVAPSYDITIVDSRIEAGPGNRIAVNVGADSITIVDSVFRELETVAVNSGEDGGDVFVTDSTFADNGTVTPGAGGAISANGPLHVSGSSFLRNEGGNGAALRNSDHVTDVDTSTFLDNDVPGGTGAAIYSINLDATPSNNVVELSHVTMWGNTRSGTIPANISTGGPLTSFASIVGHPAGGDSCQVGAGSTSEGYSFDSGDSCGFGGATGDLEHVTFQLALGAPVIGDGPNERVIVPGFLSPAVDRIPVGDCQGTIVDQLGTIRPSDGDFDGIAECDVGSVERPLLPVFTDVGTGHPFYEEIGWMGWQGISTGSQPGPTYKPSDPVSRQAMSAFLYRLAGEPAFSPPDTPTFSDAGTGNPFFTEIEWMNAEQITTGFAGGLFKPTAAVSRQSMSAFMYRMDGEPLGPFPNPGFADVSSSHPFFLEISWMADADITTGFPGPPKTYQPSSPVSRQAMAAFMQRFAQAD
jgi:CSLREA domain-containing protein